MSALFNLLFFTTLLAFGNSNEVDELNGDWTMVKRFVDQKTLDQRYCFLFKIKATTEFVKCGDKDVPVIEDAGGEVLVHKLPAIIVKSKHEVNEAMKVKCENYNTHYVIHRLSDNYMTLDHSHGGVNVLLAKTVPTAADLEEFLKTQGLHERDGLIYCTREVLDSTKE